MRQVSWFWLTFYFLLFWTMFTSKKWSQFGSAADLGLIHTVENMSLIAATSDLYVAPTRDIAPSDQNLPRSFCRETELLI